MNEETKPTKPTNRPLCCGECIYWQENPQNEGLCRRYAPRPATMQESKYQYENFTACFPLTIKYDWCGEAEWNGKNTDEESE